MPGGGSQVRRGGRQRGSLNKATIERAQRVANTVINAQKAGTGKKLGVEILDDFANLLAGMCVVYQPLPPGTTNTDPRREPSDEKFRFYVPVALQAARWLADYQSPRLKAMDYMPPFRDLPPAPADLPKNVVAIDDPIALQRVYRQRINRITG